MKIHDIYIYIYTLPTAHFLDLKSTIATRIWTSTRCSQAVENWGDSAVTSLEVGQDYHA